MTAKIKNRQDLGIRGVTQAGKKLAVVEVKQEKTGKEGDETKLMGVISLSMIRRGRRGSIGFLVKERGRQKSEVLLNSPVACVSF